MSAPTATGARLEIVGMTAAYGRVVVLDEVRVTVEPGGWLAVIGPNGSGKSTLLRCVLGLHAHAGLVRLDGVLTVGMPRRERARQIAYAPQLPVLPASLLLGGAFLVLADLIARTVLAPAELPIGVVTAFIGAPFFAGLLWVGARRR